MMKRLPYLLPLIVFAGLAVYLWNGLGRDPSVLPSALLDNPAPQFDLPPLPGRQPEEPLATRHLATGEPVLVNFFASWCGACQVEHPILNDMATRNGVTIHAINYKDTPDRARAFLQRLGDHYQRIGADPDGRVAIDFGVYGIPETFVIDGEGRIQLRHAGPISPETAQKVILPLVEALK